MVYDPYYCAGQMVNFMHEIGVKNVINRNRDFYADVDSKEVPGKSKHVVLYDVVYGAWFILN